MNTGHGLAAADQRGGAQPGHGFFADAHEYLFAKVF